MPDMSRVVLFALVALAPRVDCASAHLKAFARARRVLAPPFHQGVFAEFHPDHKEAVKEHGGGGHEPEQEHGGHHGHERAHSRHHHDHNEDIPTGGGAHSVAVGLVFTVLLVPSVVALALEGGIWTLMTMKMIDTWTSIFLAVLWFNAFSQVLVTFRIRKTFPYGAEVVAIIQVLVLYVIAMFVANLWRDKTMKLVTFCSVGAHYIAFAGIQAGGSTQRAFSEEVSGVADEPEMEPVASFGFVIICLVALIGIAMLTTMAFKRTRSGSVPEPVEELQLDILGLVISFLVTQAMRQTITGRYPTIHEHGGDQEHHGEAAPHLVHKGWQRLFMLGWAVGLTILAMIVLPLLHRIELHTGHHGYWSAAEHVTKVVLIMSVAWGYLLWGQWTFFETIFAGDQMFGQMLFAVTATIGGFFVLILVCKIAPERMSASVRDSVSIIIMGVSLVTAWSWEHCFNVALDVIGQKYQVGYGGLVPKVVLAILIPIVILPTYVRHVKPFVFEQEEHARGTDEEEARKLQEEGAGNMTSALRAWSKDMGFSYTSKVEKEDGAEGTEVSGRATH